MVRVIIASKNPVKIQAVKIGFEKMFPNQEFEFVVISVASGVPDQPMSNDQTFLGAKNRADNAREEMKDADFCVGIEGGVEQIEDDMQSFAWVVIRSGNKYGKAKSGTFFLPNEVVRHINDGKELGEANDIVFKRNNSKQECGAVGILTENIIDRTKYYTDAVIFALIPFKNTDLY